MQSIYQSAHFIDNDEATLFRFGRNVQPDRGHKHDNDEYQRALSAVMRVEPLRELGKDKTGFNPLDE